jgi:NADP-dependent 3-hydroxy acid dehydrogenase YdfG
MASSLKPLGDQVIVLTGALGAVGLCTARIAADTGASLVLVSRAGGSSNNVHMLDHSGSGKLVHLRADVCSREELCAAAEAAVQRFGRIDTWINNAGMSIYGRLDEVSEGDCRRLFDINFWGAVNGSMVALPHLVATGGSLINVGSDVCSATAMQGMYVSSKEAVKAFTHALRLEVRQTVGASVAITLIDPAADMQECAGDPMRVAHAILRAAGAVGIEERGRAWGQAPDVRSNLPWPGEPPFPFDAMPAELPLAR